MQNQTCFNCGSKSASLRAFTHHGVTSHVCRSCHERLALAAAAALRYTAIVEEMLGLRPPRG